MQAPREPDLPAIPVESDRSDLDRSPSTPAAADRPRTPDVRGGTDDRVGYPPDAHLIVVRRQRRWAQGRTRYLVECPLIRIPAATWSLVLPPDPSLEHEAVGRALHGHVQNCALGDSGSLGLAFEPDDPSFFEALGLRPTEHRPEPSVHEGARSSAMVGGARFPRLPSHEWPKLLAAHRFLAGLTDAARSSHALERNPDWCALEAWYCPSGPVALYVRYLTVCVTDPASQAQALQVTWGRTWPLMPECSHEGPCRSHRTKCAGCTNREFC